jgi:hypothetical protein
MNSTVGLQPRRCSARIKSATKTKTAYQQPHDHEIGRKAVRGHARKLLDSGSDLALIEELSDLRFGHGSLRFPYGLSLTHSKM